MTVSIFENSGSAREGTITIAGNVVRFTQAAAPPSPVPTAPTASCNYETLRPNFAEELRVFEQNRWYEFAEGRPVTVWLSPYFAETSVEAQVRSGLESWSNATRGRVGRISYVPNYNEAQITVEFGNTGINLAKTLHSQTTPLRWAGIVVDVNFFVRPDQCNGTSSCRRLIEHVAAHEMGHVLGFYAYGEGGVGHTRTDSVMNVSQFLRTPSTADVNTILTMYGCSR